MKKGGSKHYETAFLFCMFFCYVSSLGLKSGQDTVTCLEQHPCFFTLSLFFIFYVQNRKHPGRVVVLNTALGTEEAGILFFESDTQVLPFCGAVSSVSFICVCLCVGRIPGNSQMQW